MGDFCGIWNMAGKPADELLEPLSHMATGCGLSAAKDRLCNGSLVMSWSGENISCYQGLVFCGAIYNRNELNRFLDNQYNNNAEILHNLFTRVGVSEGLKRVNGIFSLAWFRENTLVLAKDHFGVSPLYYAQFKDEIVFCSRLAGLTSYPGYSKKVDTETLSTFIKFNWVPAHLCIYHGIEKMPPGHYARFRRNDTAKAQCYFDAVHVALNGQSSPLLSDDKSMVEEFKYLLDQAVECRLNNGPSQGLLLSGGIDSSLLAAVLGNKTKLNTFTIGFEEQKFNEADYARQVAKKVKAAHHEDMLQGQDALELLPRLVSVYEEPFADQSQIPTLAAMLLASQINEPLWLGDGGDELFLGYPRHVSHARYALPHDPSTGKVRFKTYLLHPWRSFLYFALRQPMNYMDRHVTNPEYRSLLVNYEEPDLGLKVYNHIYKLNNPSRQAALFDVLTYLASNGVIKASRLAASLGITICCPLLDCNLFTFAMRLPMHMLAEKDGGKRIIRKVLYEYYPREWIDRPKSGFGAPVGDWLQNEFLSWRDDLLNEEAIRSQGYFNYDEIKKYLARLGKRGSITNRLWAVLMFQVWARREGII